MAIERRRYMWYLSKNQSYELKALSRDLIAKNGWMDQFTISNKVLLQFHIQLGQLNLGKPNRFNILKEMVDTLIVLQHPINELKITDREIHDIAFHAYDIDGIAKKAKIPRTYERILNIQNYQPTLPLQKELDKLAPMIIEKQKKKLGAKHGIKFQVYRTMEELLELAAELSKFVRICDTRGTADYIDRKDADNRIKIIDEIYDVLFTLRYVMLPLDIKIADIRKLLDIRLQEISMRELGG
ncbi:MAG: hypothetical protein LBF28_01415 [Rickettsiales bacterium]|jgi:NTP pyrophosphatase (non-canonical NTP hydrolase)|nr:hypothetical protein [Rickettsiales bacterium]